MNALSKLVVIVGPTAVGKTQICLGLAHEFDGEIVNADATAMYRYLDIGSAKPSVLEQQEVPHHLVDIAFPDKVVSVAEYQQLAYEAIDGILARGRVPFLVGGSGLYVQIIVEGFKIPPVPPNIALRRELEDNTKAKGVSWLHDQLIAVDPLAAACINPHNTRRVIRALEVYEHTGVSITKFWNDRDVRYDPIVIGLTRNMEELVERIDARVEKMLQQGLVSEVKRILERGYLSDCPALLSIGYKQVVRYLQGLVDLETTSMDIKLATRRLARRQLKDWFRLDDNRIHWHSAAAADTYENICTLLESYGLTRYSIFPA